jgi:hypothetical protein
MTTVSFALRSSSKVLYGRSARMARMVVSFAAEPTHWNLVMSNFTPSTAVEGADRQAVGLGDVVHVVGGDDAVAARHVLHDYRRLPRQVLRQVARQQPRSGIVAAARLVADEDGDRLAGERLRQRERRCCGEPDRRGQQLPSLHPYFLLVLACT